MNTDNQIIRLASINAALQQVKLNDSLLDEKNEIIKSLAQSKTVIVSEEDFSFTNTENEKLYEEAYQNF